MNDPFGRKINGDQNSIAAELQARATSAGLAVKVVPVCEAGGGRMGFFDL